MIDRINWRLQRVNITIGARMFGMTRWPTGMLAGLAFAGAAVGAAGQTVTWKTNYFNVTGANQREIRESLRSARPWRDPYDAVTDWNVQWSFTTRGNGTTCDCEGFKTTTTITMTLPRWLVPTNTTPTVKSWWLDFHKRLSEHEVGHGKIGLSAAAEIRKQTGQATRDVDCGTLRQRINSTAHRILEEHRVKDRDYDKRTGHGARPEGNL
jgi:predicted secreted Zn-dependent protease